MYRIRNGCQPDPLRDKDRGLITPERRKTYINICVINEDHKRETSPTFSVEIKCVTKVQSGISESIHF